MRSASALVVLASLMVPVNRVVQGCQPQAGYHPRRCAWAWRDVVQHSLEECTQSSLDSMTESMDMYHSAQTLQGSIALFATNAPGRVCLRYCRKVLRKSGYWAKAAAYVANIVIQGPSFKHIVEGDLTLQLPFMNAMASSHQLQALYGVAGTALRGTRRAYRRHWQRQRLSCSGSGIWGMRASRQPSLPALCPPAPPSCWLASASLLQSTTRPCRVTSRRALMR